MKHWPKRIFVTGTDTGVGKTLVAAALAVGLGAAYWKPVQSGLEDGGDRDWVRRHAGLALDRLPAEAYRLQRPLSPHLAAAHEGVGIELERLDPPPGLEDGLVVEGAGGVMVPLNGEYTMLDLMRRLAYPVLVVGRNALGTINHTLLTVEQLRRHGVDVLGVVLNGGRNADHRKAVERYGQVEVIGEVERFLQVGPAEVRRVFERDLGGA